MAEPTDILQTTFASRGYVSPTHEYLAHHDPAFLRAYNSLAAIALYHDDDTHEDRLPAVYCELIVIGILCFRGAASEVIETHMRRARRLGASSRHLLHALEAAMLPGGAPVLTNGVRALAAIVQSETG